MAAALQKYGGLTPDDFHLPRLRYSYTTPYTDEIVEDTYHWMVRWGLLSGAACAADLVDNRLPAAATAMCGCFRGPSEGRAALWMLLSPRRATRRSRWPSRAGGCARKTGNGPAV